MKREIARFHSEGYSTVWFEEDERVWGLADLDIDADGANGQNGAKAAYRSDDSGSEALANGGMGIRGGRVVGITSWWRDIVIHELNADGPKIFPGGVIASKTAYHFKGVDLNDPAAYLDSQKVPYFVVQQDILNKTKGAVMGCRGRVTVLHTGQAIDCIVGDAGPRNKIGEGSIALADLGGIKSSPRTGGMDFPGLLFELWAGVHGMIGTRKIPLLRSNGDYIDP